MERHRADRSTAIASLAAVGAVCLLVIGVFVTHIASHSSAGGAHSAGPTKSLIPGAGTSTSASIAAPLAPGRRPRVLTGPNAASCSSANVNQTEWGVTPGRPPAVCP